MQNIAGLGSPAQIGTFVVVLVAALRLVIPWRKQTHETQGSMIKQYAETCGMLRDEVKILSDKLFECEDKCDRDIKKLNETINGIQRQHTQEQISMINAIIHSVDAPELKALLKTLQSVQVALQPNVLQTQVGNVLRDKKDKQDD